MWDAGTGERLAALPGHRYEVSICAFSPDGRLGLSAFRDGTVMLWDTETGRERLKWSAPDGRLFGGIFSPDSRSILIRRDKRLDLWDVASGRRRAELAGHDLTADCCAFSSDGSRIVSAARDATLRLWDAATGSAARVLTGHGGAVNACAFSPDDRRILSASEDERLVVWDAITGAELLTLAPDRGPVRTCAFSPDGRWMAAGFLGNTLKVWDAESGGEGWEINLGSACRRLAWSSDPTHLAAGTYSGTVLVLRLEGSALPVGS